jgi:hypothetical protein
MSWLLCEALVVLTTEDFDERFPGLKSPVQRRADFKLSASLQKPESHRQYIRSALRGQDP